MGEAVFYTWGGAGAEFGVEDNGAERDGPLMAEDRF